VHRPDHRAALPAQRSRRAGRGEDPARRSSVRVPVIEDRAVRHEDVLKRLARLEDIILSPMLTPEGAVSTAVVGRDRRRRFTSPTSDRRRRGPQAARQGDSPRLDKDITSTEKRLSATRPSSPSAPEEIVEENRQRLVDWAARREKAESGPERALKVSRQSGPTCSPDKTGDADDPEDLSRRFSRPQRDVPRRLRHACRPE
jgi:hypothetical protein